MPDGVIHDLGYAHYDGERLGRGAIARSLAVETAKGAFGFGRSTRAKVMPFLILVAISLPALIIVVVATLTDRDELAVRYTTYVFLTQLLVMIFVASQAPAAVSRDLRFRVMPLYFSRPLQRDDYILAKYAALTAATLALMVLPLTILLVGALLAELPVGEQVPDYLRALGGAVVVALVLSAIALLVAALTPRRGLGVAAIIAALTLLVGIQGTVQAIGEQNDNQTLADYSGLISPFGLADGIQTSVLGAATELETSPPGAVGGLVFVLVAVALIGGCLLALRRRYRRVTL
jgi:ABC-2 type transport system permease protein